MSSKAAANQQVYGLSLTHRALSRWYRLPTSSAILRCSMLFIAIKPNGAKDRNYATLVSMSLVKKRQQISPFRLAQAFAFHTILYDALHRWFLSLVFDLMPKNIKSEFMSHFIFQLYMGRPRRIYREWQYVFILSSIRCWTTVYTNKFNSCQLFYIIFKYFYYSDKPFHGYFSTMFIS